MRHFAVLAPLLLAFAALSACVTYERVTVAEIDPGDHVLVTTHAGEELGIRVREVDAAEGVLVGGDRRVAFTDIGRIERRTVSWGRTATAIGGVTLILLASLSLAILAVFAAP